MLMKETFTLSDMIIPIFNMIFIQYFWITYSILAVIGFFLFYYRIRILLHFYRKMLHNSKKGIELSKNRIPRLENRIKQMESRLL